ncbi:hypothetical protein KF728_18930 [Candidatus Obscuribacterales bacterium]|nr:hypothetical protein [Candidatus Obscuribacterales bacterium]
MKIQTRRAFALGLATLALPFVSTCCPAWAGSDDRLNFREFRDLNPELEKQVARQMFREFRQNDGPRGTAVQHVAIPVPGLNLGIPDVAATVSIVQSRKRDRFLETPRVRHQSLQSVNNNVVRLENGVNLDLTSSERNIVLGRNLFNEDTGSISIKVGNETKVVAAGTQVTAAEYVAVKQVLSGGNQSLDLGKNGAAIGGSVDLGALTDGNAVMRASALTVASGVTAYGDFGKGSDFKLNGDLNNFGSVETFSSNSRNDGAIRADDINNYRGATISSTTNLTLDAAGNLTNDGAIVAMQGLSLTAGGEIRNSGTVSSVFDLNLESSSMVNRGLLQSVSGSVNLDADPTIHMTVVNSRGTISAANGAINVRAADYAGSAGSTVFGGDLLSRELNLHAGNGLAEVNVGKLTGVLNETGKAAHVFASTDVLNLGNICLTGDPTYYNSLGDINITANMAADEALVIIAAGNITVANGVNIAARNDTRGFNITFIAGADIEPVTGSNSPTLPPLTDTSGEVILSGKASKTGGSIVFDGGNVVTSRSVAGGGAENAGNIWFYAFAGKNDNSGSVDLGDDSVDIVQILAGGRQGGSGGFVTVVAGGEQAINMGTGVVDTNGGVGGGLTIITAQPVSSDKKLDIRYFADGSLDPAGAWLINGDKFTKNAVANVGNFIGESIDVIATNINVTGAIVADSTLEFFADSNITFDPGATPIEVSTASLTAGGNIGTRTEFVQFGASLDSITTQSVQTYIEVTAGSNPLTAGGGAGESYSLRASTRPVDALNLGYSPSYSFEVLKLNSLSFSSFTQVIEEFSLEAQSTDTLFGAFTNIARVSIDAEGSIGTLLNPFETTDVDTVDLRSATGAIFYQKNGDTTETTLRANAASGLRVAATGDLNLTEAYVLNGDLSVFGNGGTLSLGILDAAAQISVAHDGEKAKLVLSPSANLITRSPVAGAAPVNISLGPTSTTVVPASSIKNLSVFDAGSGEPAITGNGFKVKKGAFLSIGNSDIRVNNGLKTGSLSFGKDSGASTGL